MPLLLYGFGRVKANMICDSIQMYGIFSHRGNGSSESGLDEISRFPRLRSEWDFAGQFDFRFKLYAFL